MRANIKGNTESDMKSGMNATDVFARALEENAPAKINLYLHVTGRRDDGYHFLDSLVVFAGARDTIRYVQGEEPLHLKVTGCFGDRLDQLTVGEDNLVVKAAKSMQAFGQGDIRGGCLLLEKNLPIASGIGGGSSDAAATLRLLNRAWGINVDQSTLLQISEKLGADVPVCLLRQSLRMEGIGNRFRPVPVLPQYGIVLVNCGQAISTHEIFGRRCGEFKSCVSMPTLWRDVYKLVAFLKEQTNDLEVAACELCPDIREVLSVIAAQDHCLMARMSGSGATCFGIFPSIQRAQHAADCITNSYQEWWSWGGGSYSELSYSEL